MKTEEKGIELIKKFESLHLKAYQCPAGVWTIGFGTTRINRKLIDPAMIITEPEAINFFTKDLELFELAVLRNVIVPLTQNQFDALVSFVYNLGEANLKRSTLLKKLNQRDYIGASNEFRKWNRAGGKVWRGLTRRRLEEQKLFLLNDKEMENE